MHSLLVRMTIVHVWTHLYDPGTDDSSKVTAQEDTTAHTGYSVIHRELAVGDGV
jgi:hypothetical protein